MISAYVVLKLLAAMFGAHCVVSIINIFADEIKHREWLRVWDSVQWQLTAVAARNPTIKFTATMDANSSRITIVVPLEDMPQ